MIAIGADHRGFFLKKQLKQYLKEKGYEVKDLGNHEYSKTDDYPKFALKVADYVTEHDTKGILVCGTGIGMSIAANKVNGVRAAVIKNFEDAKITRQHNNANIICLRGSTQETHAKRLVGVFLKSEFEGGRHERRVQQIRMIEQLQKRK